MDAIFEQWTIRYLKRKLLQLIKVNKKIFLLNLKLLIDAIFGQINLEFNGKGLSRMDICNVWYVYLIKSWSLGVKKIQAKG